MWPIGFRQACEVTLRELPNALRDAFPDDCIVVPRRRRHPGFHRLYGPPQRLQDVPLQNRDSRSAIVAIRHVRPESPDGRQGLIGLTDRFGCLSANPKSSRASPCRRVGGFDLE